MTNRQTWAAVDAYFADALLKPDADLDAAAQRAADANLPAIAVAANQGKLIHLLVKLMGAKRILEIGTLGGFSTIWLAKALPAGGDIVTLELDPHHAATAVASFQAAGLADRIRVIEGPAAESLRDLHAEDPTPFDFIFIDADKPSNPTYFDWALRFSHPGSLIFIDNVVREGRVADVANTESDVVGVRQVTQMIAAEPRVEAVALQTVGEKSYDGFILARVTS
jgi:predicted O-methyltransferase YrrM